MNTSTLRVGALTCFTLASGSYAQELFVNAGGTASNPAIGTGALSRNGTIAPANREWSELAAEFGASNMLAGLAGHALLADDEYRLDAPFATLGPLGPQLGAMSGLAEPLRPARVETFSAGPDGTAALRLGSERAGWIELTALHVPGHTQGSTVYLVDAPAPTALTGDVLFAGTIGRTDLPGGDQRSMMISLTRLARLAPGTIVVPGHGPSSTIADELATNPYLRAAR